MQNLTSHFDIDEYFRSDIDYSDFFGNENQSITSSDFAGVNFSDQIEDNSRKSNLILIPPSVPSIYELHPSKSIIPDGKKLACSKGDIIDKNKYKKKESEVKEYSMSEINVESMDFNELQKIEKR